MRLVSRVTNARQLSEVHPFYITKLLYYYMRFEVFNPKGLGGGGLFFCDVDTTPGRFTARIPSLISVTSDLPSLLFSSL